MLISLTVLHTSCHKPVEITYKEIKNMKLEKPSNGVLEATADVVMSNPNSIGAQLTESYFDLYINENLIGNSTQRSSIEISKTSEFTIPIHVNIDSKKINLFSNAFDLIQGKKIRIKMIGFCKVKKMGITFTIPINHTQEQSLNIF